MAEVISRTDLENAYLDLQTIEDVANESASFGGDGLVHPRLGGNVKTLAKVIADLAATEVGDEAVAAGKNTPLVLLDNVAGSGTYTADAPAYVSEYENGQIFLFVPSSTNGADNPTLNIGGIGALPIYHADFSPCEAGDLVVNRFYLVRVSGSADILRILWGFTVPGTALDYTTRPASAKSVMDALKTPFNTLNSVGGTANAITASGPAHVTSYTTGDLFLFIPSSTNTAAAPTLNINSLGALPVEDHNGVQLEVGDLTDNEFYLLRVSGGNTFRILFRGVTPRRLLTDANLLGTPTAASTPARGDTSKKLATTRFVERLAAEVEQVQALGSETRNVIPGAVNDLTGAASFNGAPTLTASSVNDVSCYRMAVAAGQTAGKYLRILEANHPELFEAARVSMSLLLLAIDAGPATGARTSRVLLQQYNGSTVEITGARAEYALSTTGEALTEPTRVRFSNVALDAACVELRIYLDAQNADGASARNAYFRELYLGTGPSAAFRAPGGLSEEQLETVEGRVTSLSAGQLDTLYPSAVNPWEFPDKGSDHTLATASDGVPLLVSSTSGYGADFTRTDRARIEGNTVNAGATLYSTGNSTRLLLRQMDAAGVEIRDESDGNGDYRYEWDLPAGVTEVAPYRVELLNHPISPNCAELRFWTSTGSVASVKIGKPWLSGKARSFTPYAPQAFIMGRKAEVTPGGLTLRQAVMRGASTVVVNDGVYTAAEMSLIGTDFRGVQVVAARDAMPIVRGGVACTGFTAVSGRTDVYVADCTTAPGMYDVDNPKGFVFCLGTPFDAISAADRHPAHHGRSHRVPHYPLFAGPTDLDELETAAATRKSWYYDAANDKLYVNSVPGVDPLTMVIRVPYGYALDAGQRHNTVEMQGITYEFMGLKFDDMNRYDLENLTVIGSPVDGLSLDKTRGTDRFCSVMASSNDNWNGHGGTGSGSPRQDGYAPLDYLLHSIEPYSGWAWDDGRSLHERGRGRVDGGLLEYNGSTGCAPAGGAEESYYNMEVRACGWDEPTQGGIALVNTVIDDGTGCTVNCHGVIVRDMPRGFSVVQTGNTHVLNLFNTKTYDCSEYALFANATSRINVHRHYDSGSAALKGGTGTIAVDNGTLLT